MDNGNRSSFKIVLLGSTHVGKSSIIKRKLNPDYDIQSINATTSPSSFKYTQDGIDLIIWDTAGQETYQSMVPIYIQNCFGVLYVFDITDRKSFEDLPKWHRTVQDTYPAKISLVVGNKVDMLNKRTVKGGEAENYAKSIHAKYIETSALNGSGIDTLFAVLVQAITEQQHQYDKVQEGITIKKDTSKKKKGCC